MILEFDTDEEMWQWMIRDGKIFGKLNWKPRIVLQVNVYIFNRFGCSSLPAAR